MYQARLDGGNLGAGGTAAPTELAVDSVSITILASLAYCPCRSQNNLSKYKIDYA